MPSVQAHPSSELALGLCATETGLVHGVTLDRWLTHSWERGVQLDQLEELCALRVRTLNSTYDLAVVSRGAGEVLVRGGRYFSEWTRVHFAGCSLGGSLLKRHGVHIGLRMEFQWDGRRVVTSPVCGIGRGSGSRPSGAC